MKKIILLMAVVIVAAGSYTFLRHTNDYKEGDIVFQISKSKQSSLIKKATGSKWTHCGIIIENGKEKYVLEASKTVRLTPLQQWIAKAMAAALKAEG